MSDVAKKFDVVRAQDEKFNWISKGANKRRANFDVSIVCVKYGGKPCAGISFTFRNDVWQFFEGSIEFAIFKNRIMFRTAKKGEGLVLYRGADNCPNRYAKIRLDDSTNILKEKFIGDYELKYDSFYELYYIEVEEDKD